MSAGSLKTSGRRWLAAARSNRVRGLWLAGLLGVLTFCLMLSVTVGTRNVEWADIAAALDGAQDNIGQAAVALRIPRTLLAILAGAALGLSGAIMQGVTRNPLADPGILGVNMGASLAVVIGVAWFGMSSAHAYIWTAIAGAGCAAVFVYTIGSLGRGGATPLKLALAGAATSVAFASMVIAVVLPRGDIAGGIHSWQIGGVGGATYECILPVLPFLAAGLAISLLSARKLNSLALGDELAAGLGENVAAARAVASLGAILLCGATTAVCGPIGFLGLVVPHVSRTLIGVDHRWLLPFSAVGGAVLLLGSDILGRIIARPGEIDVGIVTALIGAPFFIWIVRRQRVREPVTTLLPTIDVLVTSRRRRAHRHSIVLAMLLALVLVIFGITLSIGQTFTPPIDVVRVLLGETVPEHILYRRAAAAAARLAVDPRRHRVSGWVASRSRSCCEIRLPVPTSSASPPARARLPCFAIVVLSMTGPMVSILAVAAGLGVARYGLRRSPSETALPERV